MIPPQPNEFPGTERFRVLGRLGQGGMGVVYRAFDRERGVEVALKTLPRLDAAAIYRFKQEFRALADLSHANLVGYHELFAGPAGLFFTMEIVDGQDFFSWVRGARLDAFGQTDVAGQTKILGTMDVLTDASSVEGTFGGVAAPPPAVLHALHEGRLRDALAQLARAVAAVHAAGKLHRDIKPSNVMVTQEGRVVLLDFGLARDVAPGGTWREENVEGTPGYMAPEQGSGRGAVPASDWYAVGAMLFEVLTGRLPFVGSVLAVLAAKMSDDAPPLRTLAPDAPADLADLTDGLLRRDAAARPSGDEVLRRLGVTPTAAAIATAQPVDADAAFVGREAAFDVVRRAL
ncbi:MAG TPA: serine/threonine-protein kinase, partial [Minicystis sp.]|nr:serine/threonine-protein kinase [Minicystis sp.]